MVKKVKLSVSLAIIIMIGLNLLAKVPRMTWKLPI